ncbi:DUF302 domain-containing protein [Ruegeria sp. Ofav3-42]|uniref:DUF302 domain-containing protein n=1 Tax=Ruegeria sp. Ofav3-42 TaxID=2917759 RepID=UPI001EF5F4A5|nr:DUF302 domain-containing protein [Ruegeria sp. Ofav3-42]MCG7518931.1 DUF302 domain-containing protein [Ruegeria sp. Ofav3-42]
MKAISTVLCLLALPALAQEPLSGWAVHPTDKSYDELVADTKSAVKENGLIVVTQAGPTKAAAARGIIIPGNLVIGAFNNDYAVRVLETSVSAMIEAPIRFYVTENDDGTATLSYKTPSYVFAPYVYEGGEPLRDIAQELDTKFQAVAETAVK